MTITRSALRYYGGKASLADWIVPLLPPHDAFHEPFCGGASILLGKAPAAVETINDLDSVVTTFWRVLRDQPDEFIWQIKCTPFSREEVDRAVLDAPDLPDLERARRLYIRSWQTVHGAPTRDNTGWRCERKDGGNARGWAQTDHLWTLAARLQRVQVEHRSAFESIPRFDTPTCLHLVDPPYLPETRGRRWADRSYAHELTREQHRELAAVLHGCAGMVVLCGYASPLYGELYPDWTSLSRGARMQSHNEATEVLWLNPKAATAQRQLSLEVA